MIIISNNSGKSSCVQCIPIYSENILTRNYLLVTVAKLTGQKRINHTYFKLCIRALFEKTCFSGLPDLAFVYPIINSIGNHRYHAKYVVQVVGTIRIRQILYP